ncbi:MAG: DUF1329 domain-containing protein [Micropepsaceae bacterium]
MNFKSALVISLLVFALCAPLASAKVSEEAAERLGEDLTPLGAEVAGEGDVPPWTGGLTGVPKGIKFDPKTEHPPNPYPDDKIKYTITRQNMAAYDALLTDGHKAMLKRVPGFKLNVYQSRRSCTVPKFVQEATKDAARNTELTKDGEGVVGVTVGTPFPFPGSGKELMWNHKLRYLPHKMVRDVVSAQVDPSGAYKLVHYDDRVLNRLAGSAELLARGPNISVLFKRTVIWPTVFADIADADFLMHETINGAIEPRKVWAYSPGTRRVRRGPNFSYDGPSFENSALFTADSFDGFNGALDRYDWAIVRRSVKIVPYNSYLIVNSKSDELIGPKYLAPGFVRYEPHRVWMVEARLRPGQRHIYERRVLHLDEDTYTVLSAENYDSRGKLWRTQEIHTINFYQAPVCLPIAQLVYDLRGWKGYAVGSLTNEERRVDVDASDKLQESGFTPESIRAIVER